MCRSVVFWRWVVAVQIWMASVAWWDGSHLPQQTASAGASPLDVLGQTVASLSWHGMILLGGLVAAYGLVICVPMWAASEVLDWRARSLADVAEQQHQIMAALEEQRRGHQRQRVEPGIVPRP